MPNAKESNSEGYRGGRAAWTTHLSAPRNTIPTDAEGKAASDALEEVYAFAHASIEAGMHKRLLQEELAKRREII
jgi:hypothetical protein